MNQTQVEAILYFYKHIDAEINMLHQMKRRTEAYYPSNDYPEEIKREIERQELQRQELAAMKQDIIKGLEFLESTTKIIIFNFYILNKNWEEIGHIVHYSPRSCQYKRNEGIDQLKEIYKQSELLKGFEE